MKTTKEKIEVMQAFEDGREIEWHSGMPSRWHTLFGAPTWNWAEIDYRIKQSTILVNGIEVPEPCRVMPCVGKNYYFPHFGDDSGVMCESFRNDGYDKRVFEAGCMHLTEAAARTHYEALILPSKQK